MKNLTIIGLRLLAIWFFIDALNYLQTLPFLFSDQGDKLGPVYQGTFLVFIIYLAITIFLYFKAPFLADKISGGNEGSVIEVGDYEKLTAILFATVGLLIFFGSIESLIRSIWSIGSRHAVDPQNPNQLLQDIQQLVLGGGIQMIVGLYLVVSGKKIANWWYHFREWT